MCNPTNVSTTKLQWNCNETTTKLQWNLNVTTTKLQWNYNEITMDVHRHCIECATTLHRSYANRVRKPRRTCIALFCIFLFTCLSRQCQAIVCSYRCQTSNAVCDLLAACSWFASDLNYVPLACSLLACLVKVCNGALNLRTRFTLMFVSVLGNQAGQRRCTRRFHNILRSWQRAREVMGDNATSEGLSCSCFVLHFCTRKPDGYIANQSRPLTAELG